MEGRSSLTVMARPQQQDRKHGKHMVVGQHSVGEAASGCPRRPAPQTDDNDSSAQRQRAADSCQQARCWFSTCTHCSDFVFKGTMRWVYPITAEQAKVAASAGCSSSCVM